MFVSRTDGMRSYDEILERILDRGMVLDGLSHLAALASNSALSAQTTHSSNEELSKKITPLALVCPPRSRDR